MKYSPKNELTDEQLKGLSEDEFFKEFKENPSLTNELTSFCFLNL